MNNLQRLIRRITLQHRRSLPLTKAVVTTAIVLSTVTLIALHLCQWDSRTKLGQLQEQAAQLVNENTNLANRIENIDSLESIRQIADEKLNLVDPGTIIIEESE